MGSKMSFGRGSTDQNIVSELTSVGPRRSIQESSDQVPKDKRSAGKDLESRCGEEMKTTEMNPAAMESHPSGRHVNAETAGGPNCLQSEQRTLSPAGTEAESHTTSEVVCGSASHRNPSRVHRRRGRPRKKTLDPAGSDAVQHEEVSTKLPLPTSLENHNSDKLPNALDDGLIDDSCLKVKSNPNAVSDNKVDEEPSTLPRRKRGRPKKGGLTASCTPASDAVAPSDAAAPCLTNIYRPTRNVRSREQLNSDPAQNNADCPQTKLASNVENSNTANFQGVKRRSCRLQANQPAPAKVPSVSDIQRDAVSPCNDRGCAVPMEVVGRVGKDERKLAGTDGNDDQPLTQAGAEKEQENEAASPQRLSPSQSEPQVPPREGVNAIEKGNEELQPQPTAPSEAQVEVESQEAEQSNTDVMSSPEDAQKSVEIPLEVKDEEEEMEVDSLNQGSELKSPKPIQNCANDSVQSEKFPTQLSLFRRKRGGKRRRKVTKNVQLTQEYHVAKELEPIKEDTCDTKQQADCDDVGQRADADLQADVIYIKKGGKTLMKCRYCERIFKFHSQFVIHVRIHTGERPFKCQECGKGFSKNSNLNLHLKTHSRNKMYQSCPFCNIKFSVTEYASHMEMHAQELVQDCKKTNRPERRSKGSSGDNKQEAQKAFLPEKRERKVCQYCSKSFQFQSALVRHIRVHTGEKPYKCDICGKAFGQAYFLRVHELTHWSVKRYNCTRCEKSFTHYSNAKNHTCRPVGGSDDRQPNGFGKPSLTYTCHICKSVFSHLQEFNSHMRDHKGAKLYRCLYCDKLFGVLSEFTAHHSLCKVERNAASSDIKEEETMSLIQYTVPALRCTTGNNAVPIAAANCETRKKQSQTCNKKRSAKTSKPFQSTVLAHPLSHLVSKLNKVDNRSDPRKYLCPGCGRLFRHMGRLRAHMLTHSPDRSYTCACCGKILANWKKLWRHQRVHRQRRGRFACPQCGQGFRFVGPYKNHMRKHPEFQWVQVRPKKTSLPYQCEQCSSSFKTLDLLFSHQLSHSSTQDTLKDSSLNLSVEDHSMQPSKSLLNPPTNSSAVSCIAHKEKTTSVNALAQPPASTAPPLSTTPIISFVQSQYLTSANPSGPHSRICSIQDRKDGNERTNENAPITPLRTVKRHMTLNANKSDAGPSDGVQCAVCGQAYSAISELYQHYLQHARGQV